MITTQELILLLLLIFPFLSSVIIGFFRSTAHNNESWFAGSIIFCCLILTIVLYPSLAQDHKIIFSLPWLPQWGLNFTLRFDGLSGLFLLLIHFIGLLIIIYARYYLNPADPVPRFFSFLLAFMGSMAGIVLSGNLIFLVIFWEMTSIFSFLLIGYWYHNSNAREGARMSLIITGFGGFSLLIGVLLIGSVTGSFDLDVILQSREAIITSPLYVLILLAILTGTLSKSAQVFFHFWLPAAMSAPTPASAYLHSATMVKAGIFLLLRLWPVLAQTEIWFWIVCTIGLITLLTGAYLAMFQHDLKGLLAYSTISNLGLMTTLLGLGSPLACVAAIFHCVNHAIFKASLFMAAGIIDHETGTRNMQQLTGLFRFMPYTGTLAIIASASMAGVPFLNGFLSKEMFFTEAATLDRGSWLDWAVPIIVMIAGMFTVIYSVRFIRDVFFGPPPQNLRKKPHEPPHFMRLPIELLVFLCLFVGIFPQWSIGPLLSQAVFAIFGTNMPSYNLALWHGSILPLLMSMIALAGGSLLYYCIGKFLSSYAHPPLFFRILNAQQLFDKILRTMFWKWPRLIENFLGTQHLQTQLRWLMLGFLLLPLVITREQWIDFTTLQLQSITIRNFDPLFALIWLIGCSCAIATAFFAKFHRLTSLILLGGAGLTSCITFVFLSAPDLALTQLLVEVVTTTLFLLGLRWLPKRWRNRNPTPLSWHKLSRRSLDFILAAFSGIFIAYLSYIMMTLPKTETISNYFLENSILKTGAHNVINALLVDFRGFDTIGEMTVLAIVALGIYALLRRFRPAPESIEPPSQQRIQATFDPIKPNEKMDNDLQDYMAIPSFIISWFFPIILCFSFYLFLRGHDAPGGGFIAGITLAIGFILQYLAFGTRYVESHLTIMPVRWMSFGLLLALATGSASWLFGSPFLTSFFTYYDIPFISDIIGTIPIATALLFDFGVFSLVVGAITLILIALAHQSIRIYRIRHKNRPFSEEH